ncbi:hypothetical protein Tco_0114239 [Tanacetum coccineum]
METIHVTFDEMHQTMAPVRISSGPEHIMMTPGQLNPGLTPSPVPATTYILPKDKDLEILFQPICTFYKSFTVIPVVGELSSAQSTSGDVSLAEPKQVNQPQDYLRKWTKDHPLDNIIGNPSRPVSTRKQLASDALWCCYHTVLLKVEPKNFKMAVNKDSWFEAMQDEIYEFD